MMRGKRLGLGLGWVWAACTTPAEPRTDVAEVREDVDALADVDAVADVPEVSPTLCGTSAPTACPTPGPTWVEVEPIIEARCVSCHYGEIGGPWPLNSYGHVTDWRDSIRAAMLDCSMPPPEEQIPITLEERMTILEWIRCGMPRGG